MDKSKIKTTETPPTITVGDLRRFMKKLEIFEDNAELSFEFMMTALYPDVYKRIKKYSSDCFTNGYIQGLKDAKNVSEGNN